MRLRRVVALAAVYLQLSWITEKDFCLHKSAFFVSKMPCRELEWSSEQSKLKIKRVAKNSTR